MDILLDTHAVLWFFQDDKRLSKTVVDVIYNLENMIYVSIASVWEVAIKLSTGKLKFSGDIESFIATIHRNEFELLDISTGHVEMTTHLPFVHRDPFDRILVAQAMVEDMAIVTVDENILKYDVNIIW